MITTKKERLSEAIGIPTCIKINMEELIDCCVDLDMKDTILDIAKDTMRGKGWCHNLTKIKTYGQIFKNIFRYVPTYAVQNHEDIINYLNPKFNNLHEYTRDTLPHKFKVEWV